ncbi:MAG: hypothetical protein K6F68_07730 [Clostridiales bacterium]|nr:hypothetical protein [Clostridiales bacterium]
MKIGIDVDGVLADLGRFLKEEGEPFFKKKYGLDVVDPDRCHAEEMFGCTVRQRKNFWRHCGWHYIAGEAPIKGCSEVINKLVDGGNRIYIVTCRALTAKHGPFPAFLRKVLRGWLKKNGIKYDDIIYCPEDDPAGRKLEACVNSGIDVLIDDNPDNLLAVKDSVLAVCFDSPWNAHLDDGKIVRVKGWEGIDSFFRNMTGY